MSTSTLPEAASLEHLKNQAKALQKAASAGDAAALDRIHTHHPRTVDTATLADCQLVIAREYGFDSWPKLKSHVDAVEYERTLEKFKAAVEGSRADEAAALLRSNSKLRRAIDAPLFAFDTPAIVHVAGRSDRAMIDVLLEAGANVDNRTKWMYGGFGALDQANRETSAYLISKGANVDIHAAAKHGLIDRVRELVERDPSLVNARGGDGQTPLHFASTVDICAYLIDQGADVDMRDLDHCATAAQYSIMDAEKVRYLIDRGAKADIFIACRLGDKKLVSDILDEHSDALRWRLNHPEYQAPGGFIYMYLYSVAVRPLTLAVDFGGREFVDWLIERSGPVDRLMLGCAAGDRAVVQRVLTESQEVLVKLTDNDKAFISDAAWENRLDAVEAMLDAGFDVNTRGLDGGGPLDRAAVRGWPELVRLLIDRGASLEQTNEYGGWPLTACLWGSENWPRATGNHRVCLEALIAAGSRLPNRLFGSPEAQEILKKHGVGG